MSALPKPLIDIQPTPPHPYSSRKNSFRRNSRQSRSSDRPLTQQQSPITSGKTYSFPPIKQLPTKLKVLLLIQKSSLGLAFMLIATSIAFYLSTVHIPELWSKKYRDLETLQRQERHLVAINESLKHKLAQQAEQEENNLPLITSDNTIFIPPASLPSPPQPTNLAQKQKQVLDQDIPMGY